MAKEKVMTFVQARSKLSEIVDRVSEHGDTYVVSKRQKPVAVIIGIDRYRHRHGTAKVHEECWRETDLKHRGDCHGCRRYRRGYSRIA